MFFHAFAFGGGLNPNLFVNLLFCGVTLPRLYFVNNSHIMTSRSPFGDTFEYSINATAEQERLAAFVRNDRKRPL